MDSFASENTFVDHVGGDEYHIDDADLQEFFGPRGWQHEQVEGLYGDVDLMPTISYDQDFDVTSRKPGNLSPTNSRVEILNTLDSQVTYVSSQLQKVPVPRGSIAQPSRPLSSSQPPQMSGMSPSQTENIPLRESSFEQEDNPQPQSRHSYLHLPQIPASSSSRLEAQNHAMVWSSAVPSSCRTRAFSKVHYSPLQSGLGNQDYTQQNTTRYQLRPANTVTIQDYQSQVSYLAPSISFPHTDTQNENQSRVVSTQFPSSLSGSGHQTPYHNKILNEFRDPAVPLRVIDNFFFPFPRSLVTALQQELTPRSKVALNYVDRALETLQRRQGEQTSQLRPSQNTAGESCNSFEHGRNGQSYRSEMTKAEAFDYSPYDPQDPVFSKPRLAVPEQTPRSQRSGTSTPGSRVSINRRKQNIKEFDATKYYSPLPMRPESWVARPPSKPRTLFEYTINGELIPERRYTDQEITDYIQYHPLHKGIPDSVLRYDSKLILWIQNTPADSKTRYPTIDSSKCRFESCPTKGGTIRTGEFRICFDEQSWQYGQTINPYHNAGYVHLYCMEKNFNFHQLFHTYRVIPDTRKYPYEANRMSITRDRASMLDVVSEYAERDGELMRSKAWNDTENEWFKYSLTYALTKHHMDHVADHTRKTMDARDGFSIADHMGDLQKRAEYKSVPPGERKEFIKTFRKTAPLDRSRSEALTADEDAEGDDENDAEGEPSRKRQRTG